MGATLVVWQFLRRAYRCRAKQNRRAGAAPVCPAANNTHEVARFFDGLDMAEPGLVPVQEWRPRSAAEAGARSAMWGGVGRKR